jgi:SecD/SecF fusion protein
LLAVPEGCGAPGKRLSHEQIEDRKSNIKNSMTPALTFFIGLAIVVLFGWYFATESDRLRRILGTVLTIAVTAFCLWSTYPPFDQKGPNGTIIRRGKIHLGLDLQGGTSFLIRLEPPASADGGKRPITKSMVDQAIEAIRKRVDRFGVSEPIITPQGNDRILVQIPGLDAANIQEAREQLSRVAKLEFRLVYPDNGQRLNAIDEGKEVIPPEYRIETYKQQTEGGKPLLDMVRKGGRSHSGSMLKAPKPSAKSLKQMSVIVSQLSSMA